MGATRIPFEEQHLLGVGGGPEGQQGPGCCGADAHIARAIQGQDLLGAHGGGGIHTLIPDIEIEGVPRLGRGHVAGADGVLVGVVPVTEGQLDIREGVRVVTVPEEGCGSSTRGSPAHHTHIQGVEGRRVADAQPVVGGVVEIVGGVLGVGATGPGDCLLYTSDAADE